MPIVQAGENILFGVENGVVTAHIQVQYSGPATEFGWLLPLPSMPEMTLGTDELFAQLINTTQPKYVLDAEYRGSCPFDPARGGGFGGASDADDSFRPAPKTSSVPTSARAGSSWRCGSRRATTSAICSRWCSSTSPTCR